MISNNKIQVCIWHAKWTGTFTKRKARCELSNTARTVSSLPVQMSKHSFETSEINQTKCWTGTKGTVTVWESWSLGWEHKQGEKRLSEFNNFVKPNLTHKVSNLKPSIRFYASFPLTSGNHRVHHTNSKLQNYGKTVRTLILSPSWVWKDCNYANSLYSML